VKYDDDLRLSVTGFGSQTVEEPLAVEEPLEIQLNYGAAQSRSVKPISLTMRTRGSCATAISTWDHGANHISELSPVNG
jgi:hypothetical protein